MLIDTYEEKHMATIARALTSPQPKQSWRTPDGRWWTPRSVLQGYHPRISDAWAWLLIHYWVVSEELKVLHFDLPSPLYRHSTDEPAWTAIEAEFGPGELEPEAVVGRADAIYEGPLFVEFGSCPPIKFALNLMLSDETHWMIVPYSCKYAFVFVPTSKFRGGRSAAEMVSDNRKERGRQP
jgi:hypothetical protein